MESFFHDETYLEFVRSGSLWVAWVHTILLKGRSFWQVRNPHICSWSWRKLLKLRDDARYFSSFSVGNGKDNGYTSLV
jgi:hypothetical protein